MAQKENNQDMIYPTFSELNINDYFNAELNKPHNYDWDYISFDRTTHLNSKTQYIKDRVKIAEEYLELYLQWRDIQNDASEHEARLNYAYQALCHLLSVFPNLNPRFNAKVFVEDACGELAKYSADIIRDTIKKAIAKNNSIPNISKLLEMANREVEKRDLVYDFYFKITNQIRSKVQEGNNKVSHLVNSSTNLNSAVPLNSREIKDYYSYRIENSFGITPYLKSDDLQNWAIKKAIKGNALISCAIKRIAILRYAHPYANEDMDKITFDKAWSAIDELITIEDELEYLYKLELNL